MAWYFSPPPPPQVQCINLSREYAVKAQTSLAPLSRFRGSHVTTAHAHQCCRFQSYAKTVPSRNDIDNEIDKAWTNIPGIHDNGPRDHGVWLLTLTAYNTPFKLSGGTRSALSRNIFSLWMARVCTFGAAFISTSAIAGADWGVYEWL